ncbi:class I SAM-dependent methyltransferase [Sphingomonas sp. SUN039]|uniref:class I SAM-dependent methyltransferase n=1 Tax=Sphingomonas sp. SUN039 TaxID=2937787 RepID=UPI0021640B1C|nr:methyltransferase [Sphingomonas sp. SUN039]UVO54336.1 methyltransferase [Sphingomonas sp. SUN039]
MNRPLALAGAAALIASTLSVAASAKPSPAIAAAVADPLRPAADTARDANRKPAAVVAFAGIKPGDKVADLLPGGGYFTRIFARTVGPKGKVYAVMPLSALQRPGAMDRINAAAAPYPNVTVLTVEMAKFAAPEPLDEVWTSENYHDLQNGPTADPAAVNKAIFAALKPGGVYYIEDHSAPGTGLGATSTLHRIDPAVVRSQVEAAGFRLEAQSSLLANPADPHTARSNDPSISGKTDKLIMRFRKPR